MRWRNGPSHRLVALKDIRRLTGLSPTQVLQERDTQQLVRVGDNGVREEVVRIPLGLLVAEKEGAHD